MLENLSPRWSQCSDFDGQSQAKKDFVFDKLKKTSNRYRLFYIENKQAGSFLQQINTHLTNNRMQIDTASLKNRQLAAKYLSLQECGQCLSHIERFNPREKYNQVLEFQSIDFRELFLVMVQTIYLLYMAQCHQASIKISKQIFIRRADKNVYTTYKTYILEEHFHSLQQTLQNYVVKSYDTYEWTNNNTQFQTNVFNILEFFLRKITAYSQRYPQLMSKVNKYPFQEFGRALMQLIKPNRQAIKDPRTLMQCLEKTDIFRDNSLLLTLNMSLFYEKIQPMIENDDIFFQLEEMEDEFKKQYSKALTIKIRYKLCSNLMETILKFLVNKGLVFFSVSLDEKNRQSKANEASIPSSLILKKDLTQQEAQIPSQQNRWQFYTKSSFFTINPQNFIQFISSNDLIAFERAHRIEAVTKPTNYLVEIDTQREIITVKTICNLGINVQNIDSILFQANTVSEEWYYPTFQLIEIAIPLKGPESNPNGKRLSLSISFKVAPNKSTIARFLVILDVLLIHQKIFLVQLNKPPYKRDQHLKYNLSGENIKRMNDLLIKNIERVYEAQLVSELLEID